MKLTKDMLTEMVKEAIQEQMEEAPKQLKKKKRDPFFGGKPVFCLVSGMYDEGGMNIIAIFTDQKLANQAKKIGNEIIDTSDESSLDIVKTVINPKDLRNLIMNRNY